MIISFAFIKVLQKRKIWMRKQQQQNSNNKKQEINQKTSQRSGTSQSWQFIVKGMGGWSKARKEGWINIINIQISTTPDFNLTRQVSICKVIELLFQSQPLMTKIMWSCRRKNALTIWACVIMTALAIYVIPCKFMRNSQGVNAVFVQSEIIRLMWGPVSKVALLVTSPNKCTLSISVIKSDPSCISIQTVLYVNIFFLIFYTDKAGVV